MERQFVNHSYIHIPNYQMRYIYPSPLKKYFNGAQGPFPGDTHMKTKILKAPRHFFSMLE